MTLNDYKMPLQTILEEGRESDDYGRSKYSQREDESGTVKAWEGEKVHKVAVDDLELTFRSEEAHARLGRAYGGAKLRETGGGFAITYVHWGIVKEVMQVLPRDVH
ncbi:hypothetical protein LguiB_015947 [Lonicera macranthoides]